MATTPDKPHGLFGWVDLSCPDPESAKAFYGELFGWHAEDIATPMGPVYSMMRKDGALVAGLGPQPPDWVGRAAQWASYVLVDDIDAVVELAVTSGGFCPMPAMDVMDQGRMALIGSPSGAIVGLWEPNEHTGAELFNAPGALTWNELQSRNLDADLPFYTAVLGWRWTEGDGLAGYRIGNVDTKPTEDKANCGAMSMPPDVPADVPSFWMVYFAVVSCQESFERAQELGASVAFPPMEMGPGTFAGLIDPQGAMFCVSSFPDGE
jgi:uncharacterized protein